MRKNLLSLSIATMIGSMGVANAAVIAPAVAGAGINAAGAVLATELRLASGGMGHALITPYYTVQGGNATVLSVVNTDPTNGKAVKIRFRGNSNSDDVLDFQIYMSPNDVWNGVVTKNATTGIAEFTTTDNSCTLPTLTKSVAQPFITGRLPSYATATELANHTAEGYVEIFNMADIPPNTTTTSLFASILHSAGVPRNCQAAALQTATLVDATSEVDAVSKGFMSPTTGLFGNWTIINVAQTTTFSGSMTAIRATTAGGVDATGTYVVFPQSATAASTGSTAVLGATADPLFIGVGSGGGYSTSMASTGVGAGQIATAAITAAFYDLPDMSTPYTLPAAAAIAGASTSPLAQAFNLTSALAVQSVSNEYSTDTTVNASTDWAFSMPTRRYSVAASYGTSAAAAVRFYSAVAANDGTNGGAGDRNFFYSTNTSLSGDRICVSASGQAFFDREESSRTSGAVFSPGSVANFRFCGETNVTVFGGAASVLGSVGPQSTGASAFSSGWGVVRTPNATLDSVAASANVGLPIMGSAFIKLTNAAASAGTSGTYGITSDHRFVK